MHPPPRNIINITRIGHHSTQGESEIHVTPNAVYGIEQEQETHIHLHNNMSYVVARQDLKLEHNYAQVDESHEYEQTNYDYDYVL